MDTVKIKGGHEVHSGLLAAVMVALGELWKQAPIAAYDLVMLCRAGTVPFNRRALENRGLIDAEGKPHEEVRRIVCAAVTGDGLDMTLTDPRA